MRPGERSRRRAGGFTYVGLLALIVVIGLMLAGAGQVASTVARREREAQLLWVGHEYRAAIGRYWRARRAYPQALEELLGPLQDAPVKVRYLRRLYPDPMTNAADWVLQAAPGGGIMGISSSSRQAPLKTGHFDPADHDFADAETYGDWKFTYLPGATSRKPPPPPPPRAPAPRAPGPGLPARPVPSPVHGGGR